MKQGRRKACDRDRACKFDCCDAGAWLAGNKMTLGVKQGVVDQGDNDIGKDYIVPDSDARRPDSRHGPQPL